MASAGDVNRDGFPDLIVGAPAHDAAGGPGFGKAFVYYGSADGLPSSPSWSAEGEQAGSLFGAAVGSAGDTNGDGFGDIVIGAPGHDLGDNSFERDSGRLYIYLGSAQGLLSTPALVVDGRPYDLGGSGRLGISVAFGDFNGDGFSDVVGAEFARYVGGADVFYGSASGPSATNSWSFGPQAGRALGSSVAAADLNGDGRDELIVTSSDDGEGLTPRAVFYLGSANGLPTSDPGWPPPGVPPDFSIDALENAVSLGDLDRDGYDDFVALSRDPNTKPYANHVVYRGSPTGPILSQALGGVLGAPGRLSRLGDLNGDGFTDLVAQDGSTFYLYLGSATGFRPLSDGMGTFDAVLAGAGDVDRDGFSDLVAGDAAHERVDVYRGATDWTFRVTGDVSVRQEVFPAGGETWLDITVSSAGPETVRVRLVDLFPPNISPSWFCRFDSGPLVSAACLNDPYSGAPPSTPGDIDSMITMPPGSTIIYSATFGTPSLPGGNTASLVSGDWLFDPDLSNNQATLSLGPAEDPLFADGFESGSTSAWSSSGGRGLAVLEAAALSGSYGLQVRLPVFGPAGVRDTTPQGESGYHARFLFDPNGFGGGPGAARRRVSRTVLFSGHAEGGLRPLFEVLIEANAGQLALVARASQDDGSASAAPRAAIADAPHLVDVLWRRATGEGAGDGSFVLLLDGTVAGTLSGLDNDAGGGVDQVDLGLSSRPLPRVGLRRTVFLDAFESWRLH